MPLTGPDVLLVWKKVLRRQVRQLLPYHCSSTKTAEQILAKAVY